VTLALSAELLVLGGVVRDPAAALSQATAALDGGRAADRFAAMVSALGGPSNLLEAPDRHLPTAPTVEAVFPVGAGVVSAVDVRAVGVAIIGLGGGRARETDAVDHAVGLTGVAAIGEPVGPGGRPLAVVHARDADSAARAAGEIRRAYILGDGPAPGRPPVIEALK
jgi:thymidine phosphorylase